MTFIIPFAIKIRITGISIFTAPTTMTLPFFPAGNTADNSIGSFIGAAAVIMMLSKPSKALHRFYEIWIATVISFGLHCVLCQRNQSIRKIYAEYMANHWLVAIGAVNRNPAIPTNHAIRSPAFRICPSHPVWQMAPNVKRRLQGKRGDSRNQICGTATTSACEV